MNQGGALIQVYRDGSILLTHGGTEMGQGLFTKTIQVNIMIHMYMFSTSGNYRSCVINIILLNYRQHFCFLY
jgi:hypothetical protein